MRTLDPVKHDEKRQEILNAAARCIVRDGFRGASTADICKEAGISPGHLYHYFPSKEAIITDITATGLEQIATRFAEIMQSPNALTALVSGLERHKGKKDAEYRNRSLLMLDMLAEAGRNPVIAKIVRKNTAILRGLLVDFLKTAQGRGQIDPGLDSEGVASVMLSVMDGMRTLSVRDPDVDIAKSVALLQVLFSRFLSPPRGAA